MLYKNRIVFFADILGFKSIIDSSYTTDEVEEVTGRIATALRECPAYILLYQFSPKDTGQSKVK